MRKGVTDAANERRQATRAGGFVLACACAAAFGMTSAGAAVAAPGTYVVVIEQMRFNPPALTVHQGDRVVWINKDLFPHTASSASKAFDSQSIAPNASWSYVARKSGSYPYRCNFHPAMRATLTVR
ncbi:copper-binding protein [Burkholderia pyrrocinia]|uniref:Copper-binding protein n=1 Tax=Burkholderia pyrrocinia TaxID=60550 RepID=A0A2Z5N7A1_BURPY|nr:cupredoxin family copper-binding protein [Burkholderia pyrrocinia]AXF25445.1 copper-binding protein [Burkholderia pyrrocinia]